MTVTRKLLIATFLVVATLMVVLTLLFVNYASTNLQAQEAAQLSDLRQSLVNTFELQKHQVLSLATQAANNPEIQAAFAARDRQRLIDLLLPGYQELVKQYGMSQAHFHLPPAQSFLRLHQLDQYGDDISRSRLMVVAANQEQRPVSGLEIGKGGLGMRGVVPVSYAGQHIGTVEYGIDPGRVDFESLKQQYGADWQILLSRQAAERGGFKPATQTVQAPTSDLLLQLSTLAQPFFAQEQNYQQALAGQTTLSHLTQDGRQYGVLSAPLNDYSGQVIGVVDILVDRTAVIQATIRNIVLTVVVIAILAAIAAAILAYLISRIMRPVGVLTKAAQAVASGNFTQTVSIHTHDELGILADAFNRMTGLLSELIDSLEQRIRLRTEQLRASADVGRAAVSILDTNQLLREIVNLITDRFGFYYTAVFLADGTNKWAVLREATGEAGRILKERKHQLEIGGQSMVGMSMKTGKARIALDVGEEAVRFANPLLPDTRSEIALPLVVGTRIIGTLDVQSTEVAAFDEASAAVLQSMADQIAIALSNTMQFQQAQTALQRTRQLYEASLAISNSTNTEGVLQELMTQAINDASAAQILNYGPHDEAGQYVYYEVAAHWLKEADGIQLPIGTRLPPEQILPLLPSATEPQIIRDATADTVLPAQQQIMQVLGMRALLSYALVAGSQPIGVLLIVYREPHMFSVAETQPLLALAGQIAITLRNQQLIREQQQARQQLDEINRRLTGQVWEQYARERGQMVRQVDVSPGEQASLPTATELTAPVMIHGQEVGRLSLEDATPEREWTPNEKALIQAVAGEVAIAIENARLIEQTEQRAQREARLNQIAQLLRRTTDIHTILQTATEQLSLALNTSHAQARLSTPPSVGPQRNGEHDSIPDERN